MRSILFLLALVLALHRAGAQEAPPPASEYVTSAEVIAALPSACNCTAVGISGQVDTGGRLGCGQFLLQLISDPTYFCYVVDPDNCPEALSSTQFPGAYYRGCNPTVDGPSAGISNRTLLDVVNAVPDLATFAAAAEAVGLDALLDSAGPDGAGYTVLAPSDSAFDAMLDVKGFNSTGDLLGWPRLAAVLLLHVAEGAFSPEVLAAQDDSVGVATLSPGAFPVVSATLSSRIVLQGEGSDVQSVEVPVLEVDQPTYDPTSPTGVGSGAFSYRSFAAGNGVLYVLTGVMSPPPELVSALANEPNLSTFADALSATGVGEMLSADCPNATTGACPMTPVSVFAPTNAAFDALAASINITTPQLLQHPQLADLLLYHITDPEEVTFPIMPVDLADGNSIPTLYGDNITVAYTMGLVPVAVDPELGQLFAKSGVLTLNGEASGAAGFTAPQTVTGYQGVIHAIDAVLLPFNISAGVAPAMEPVAAPAAEQPAPAAEAAPAAEPVPAAEPGGFPALVAAPTAQTPAPAPAPAPETVTPALNNSLI